MRADGVRVTDWPTRVSAREARLWEEGFEDRARVTALDAGRAEVVRTGAALHGGAATDGDPRRPATVAGEPEIAPARQEIPMLRIDSRPAWHTVVSVSTTSSAGTAGLGEHSAVAGTRFTVAPDGHWTARLES